MCRRAGTQADPRADDEAGLESPPIHRITLLSVTLLTLALAAPGAAAEPGETAEQSHAELLERLDRYQGEFTERLQQRLEARMNMQSSAALSNGLEPPVRRRHAGSATGVAVARSR